MRSNLRNLSDDSHILKEGFVCFVGELLSSFLLSSYICPCYHEGRFQELNKRLLISNDCYVRTTTDLHKQSARRLWQKCANKGDIYLGKYEVRKGGLTFVA